MPSRKEKQQMSTAEQKQKQQVKAMANMNEEQKMVHHTKENERRSQSRKCQKARMDKNENAEFTT